MAATIAKVTLAREIGHGLVAIGDDLDRIRHTGLHEGSAQQQHIRGIVFHEQDRAVRTHSRSFLSSTQKRLPRWASDSTPARPPIRSTPLRTIARPNPVPA